MNANPFILFGTTHIITIIVIALISIMLPRIYRTKTEVPKIINDKSYSIYYFLSCHNFSV